MAFKKTSFLPSSADFLSLGKVQLGSIPADLSQLSRSPMSAHTETNWRLNLSTHDGRQQHHSEHPFTVTTMDTSCSTVTVVEMISELPDLAELQGKLSSYIVLPERLGWPESDRNRIHPLL